MIAFTGNATAGNARLVANAGMFDFSSTTGPLGDNKFTAGSIEGAGRIVLGGGQLTVGSNNLSTTVSGVISDCGASDGCLNVSAGGSLVKVGTGTLTLTGANTYSGSTTINGGTLAISDDSNLGGDGSLVFNGGTLRFMTGLYVGRDITLNAAGGWQTAGGVDLFDVSNIFWSLGAQAAGPIFDNGRRRSQVTLRKLEQQEAAVNYQQTVLKAWQEVDDALSGYGAERQRNAQLQARLNSAGQAYDMAKARYAGGMTDFLVELDAQRNYLQARRDLVDSDGQLRLDLVALYKALGGGAPLQGGDSVNEPLPPGQQ